MLRIIVDPNSTPREVVTASKALLSAEAQNQSDEHKVVDVHIGNARLSAIAAELGIDAHLLIDGQEPSSLNNKRVTID